MNNSKIYFYIFSLLIFALSCQNNSKSVNTEKDQILVIVGNETISVDDFRKNYELGFSNLKTGKNRKKSYLDYMIYEKLLALKGYELGLDQSESVKGSVESLYNELLIEKLIEVQVKNKIKVSEKEIREAFNKSKVSFKFRYWSESSFEKAKNVAFEMRDIGYADAVDKLLNENPEYKINPKLLETDYLDYTQVSPELLIVLQNLPIGEISKPIELKGKYFIFQILDIRRNSMTKNEFNSKAASIEQVIFYNKFEKALIEFGTNLMNQKDIKTKRNAFNLLEDAISEWKNIDPKLRLRFEKYFDITGNTNLALNKLSDNAESSFLEYNQGSISIRDFVKYFDAAKMKKKFASDEDYLNFLHTLVAQSIRNMFLVQEAESMNLQANSDVQSNLTLWKNKWVYQEARRKLIENVSDKNAAINTINFIVEGLKEKYKIRINESILDTIQVIDFKKSRWASMQIFKYGTNKPLYPVTDPQWSLSHKKN